MPGLRHLHFLEGLNTVGGLLLPECHIAVADKDVARCRIADIAVNGHHGHTLLHCLLGRECHRFLDRVENDPLRSGRYCFLNIGDFLGRVIVGIYNLDVHVRVVGGCLLHRLGHWRKIRISITGEDEVDSLWFGSSGVAGHGADGDRGHTS